MLFFPWKKGAKDQLGKEIGITSMLATWFPGINTHMHMHQGWYVILNCCVGEKYKLGCIFWLIYLLIVKFMYTQFGALVTRITQLPKLLENILDTLEMILFWESQSDFPLFLKDSGTMSFENPML